MKKRYFVLIGIIVIYAVLVVILFGLDSLRSKINKTYIIASPGIKWMMSNGKWENIDGQTDLYNWQPYSIYADNKLLGQYDALYNDKWYLYDSNRNAVNYNGHLFGYRGGFKIKVIDFNYQELGNAYDAILTNEFSKLGFTESNDWVVRRKISIDLDNDKKNEYIYMASNLFNQNHNDRKVYSLLFIVDGNTIKVIHKEFGNKEEQYKYCVPFIQNIMDINNDSKYEFIMGCGYFDKIPDCYQLYQLNNKDEYALMIKTCVEEE